MVDFASATLHVRRAKKGTASTHPIRGDELRALRRLQREQEPKSAFVFTSERGAPFSVRGFQALVERLGKGAKPEIKAHPHMLRCGYALASKGHDTRALQAYLGHRNIQHTGSLYRVGADTVQRFLAVAAAPAGRSDNELLGKMPRSLASELESLGVGKHREP